MDRGGGRSDQEGPKGGGRIGVREGSSGWRKVNPGEKEATKLRKTEETMKSRRRAAGREIGIEKL